MNKLAAFLLMFCHTFLLFSQKKDRVLVTINNENIKVLEFKRSYEKNLTVLEDNDAKDLKKNLDLFVNYKLKVQEAYRLKLDTLASYQREIDGYKHQLAVPYLQDKDFTNQLIKEAYKNTKYERKASHILVKSPINSLPKDTLIAYEKIVAARNKILAGAPFESVAKEVSEDPSVQTNKGDLGYFSAFKMVYPFEKATYNTPVGDVSMPFKTRFGYHLVKVTDQRLSKGEVEVAHIMISDTTIVGGKKIDEVYQKLKQGEDFEKLVAAYSQDSGSKKRGGKLQKFGTGRMMKPFETVAFSLTQKNEFSKPFKTRFGYHIVRLINKYPLIPFEEMKDEIAKRVKSSGRINLSDQHVLKKLKKSYNIIENEDSKWILKKQNIQEIPKDSLQNVLLTINGKLIKQHEFVNYGKRRNGQNPAVYFENFKNEQILKYFKENLEITSTEYANTLKEYREGLLLYELMQQKIWMPSSKDSLGLKTFFTNQKSKYKEQQLSEIKGLVMSDYQMYLENQWIADLTQKSTIKINKKQFKKLIKYYEKKK